MRPDLAAALLNAALFGSLFGLLLLPGEAILLALGQEPAIAAGGGAVLVMFALGMPAILMFTATTLFLEGIGRSTPGMVVMAIANLVNFGLNYALMFEPWSWAPPAPRSPPRSPAGSCSWRSPATCSRCRGASVTACSRRCAGTGGWSASSCASAGRSPLSFGLEHGAFFAAATFAGWLGAVPLAA